MTYFLMTDAEQDTNMANENPYVILFTKTAGTARSLASYL
jgi:hypothetical protein